MLAAHADGRLGAGGARRLQRAPRIESLRRGLAKAARTS
ncbi:hypothetical protein C7S16_6677 [Burkholderia thailandensis]|uniref:Uncharacterized protein n=1 Tax=Burkholderia thailandensis TaxID=57975 RepID=A0AAW9CMY3_BURTH|nr:hypothetical protein [Burkholderia thailandensis]MDW9252218.1 hypothetical protein [Burkholderia thailandensis]